MTGMRNGDVRAAVPWCVTASAVGLTLTYLLSPVSRSLQVVSCWFAIAVLATTMTYYAFRTTRLLDRDAPQRRFWRTFALAGAVFSVGEWVQVLFALAAPDALPALTGTGVVRTMALGIGGAAIVTVLLRYPLPHRSRKERLCYLLDLATVIVAAGAYGLYLTASTGWADQASMVRSVGTVLSGPVVAMLAAFAAGRLFLSGAAPFHWHIGVVAPAAATLEALARGLGPELIRTGRPGVVFTLSLWAHALLVIATWSEHRRYLSGHGARPVARRRPYSLVPYAALAAVFLLLVITLAADGLDLRAWVVLAGAVGSTGIVVARQLVSFIDNASLLVERDTLAARLHTMAFTDSLTGLGNRALFADRLHESLQRTGRDGAEVAVLLIDLDDFKPINDRYGHAAGDAVLVQTAQRLRGSVRPGDVVARLGGDEFAILFEQPFAEGYPAVATRIANAVAAPCHVAEADSVRVRASVGVAVSTGDDDSSALLKVADEAMYRAKREGKTAVMS